MRIRSARCVARNHPKPAAPGIGVITSIYIRYLNYCNGVHVLRNPSAIRSSGVIIWTDEDILLYYDIIVIMYLTIRADNNDNDVYGIRVCTMYDKY